MPVPSDIGAKYMQQVWATLAQPELSNADLAIILGACMMQLGAHNAEMRRLVIGQLKGALDALERIR
jgi:hypothetical protein